MIYYSKEYAVDKYLDLKDIIIELEQWLKKLIDNFDDKVSEATMREQFVITYVYDYLQELKENKGVDENE